MANADGFIIPLTEDDHGEGIKDFIDKLHAADRICESFVAERLFRTPDELKEDRKAEYTAKSVEQQIEENKEKLNRLCKKC